MIKGWVKNYRSLLEWKWYHDLPTRVLFQHLLLTVNWEDKDWEDTVVKKGEIITSVGHLANDSCLSEWQVRRALKNLESTGEIKITTTNRYTRILIKNFRKYQESHKQTTSQKADKQRNIDNVNNSNHKRTTNEPQTNHKRTTTTKEYKNKRIKEDNIYVVIDNKKYRRDDPNRPLTLEERKDLGLA